MTLEQEINLVQIPHPFKATLIFKFPPPRVRITVKCPGYAQEGMLKLQFDRYITKAHRNFRFIL